MTLSLPSSSIPASRSRVRRAHAALPGLTVLVDVAAILGACFVAVIGRNSMMFASDLGVAGTLDYAGPALVFLWLAAIALVGGYDSSALWVGPESFKRVVRGTALTAAAVGILCYLAKFDLSRGFFFLAFTLGLPLLLGGRLLVRQGVHAARRQGNLQERVVLSGSPEHVDEIAEVLRRQDWLGYQVVGALADTPRGVTAGGIPVLGPTTEVRDVVREYEADVVFFADSGVGSSNHLREIVWDLEGDDVTVVVAPSMSEVSQERISVRPVGGLPLIYVEKPRTASALRSGKRIFDVVGASALLVAFAPVLAFSALMIWLHDRGPVLYAQKRVGRDGETFSCLKLRTMVQNADELMADLMAQSGTGPLLFKVKDDPRITKPGRWLRRFSFDELPQLWNVIRGDMSLVGPRPQSIAEVACYEGSMSRRLLVRPGLTGLWQVSGRSDLSLDEAFRLDLYYVDNWSMTQDLTILFRTLGAVASRRGAY